MSKLTQWLWNTWQRRATCGNCDRCGVMSTTLKALRIRVRMNILFVCKTVYHGKSLLCPDCQHADFAQLQILFENLLSTQKHTEAIHG